MTERARLGQNFLQDGSVIKKIIEAADLQTTDIVLEIGPGKGILTEELAKRAGKVIAVEIDNKLAKYLKDKFKNAKNVEIINKDILETNLDSQLSTLHSYKLIANIPYYITSPIIQKFLEAEFPPSEMILMVQKEVAERICAQPGAMSILALSVQYYARPELLFQVSKNAFNPIPEVDSAVIRITHHAASINKEETNNFFRVVRAGFCAKRKTLINNLSNSFHLDKKIVEEKLKKTGINPASRAQELNIEDWKKLSKLF